MFRNQYDTDVTVWSPEGRLLQVRLIVRFDSFARTKRSFGGRSRTYLLYRKLR